jgi:hypothetical protein
MTNRSLYSVLVLTLLSGFALGQGFSTSPFDAAASGRPDNAALVSPPVADVAAPVALPRMAPELALQVYHGRAVIQSQQLAGYSATTIIHAELPETAQQGEFEVQRHYSAPHTLQFTPVRFNGDGFVKSNIITRLLQSEVDHVKQEDGGQTAISKENYKFSYKGSAKVDGRTVHVFQLKPRSKRPGLFKGRIYLDAYTGSLVRAEGGVVKSPSFFVKKIEFVQDYTDIGNFTFPTHIHSEARARVIGRTVVDIYHRDYQPVSTALQAAQASESVPAAATK